MRSIKVGDLKIDMATYPRQCVDNGHVFAMIEAIKVGVKLPPIVIEVDTLRVVDGVHRVTALKEYDGHGAEIECIEKTYVDDREFFLDCLKYNSSHGKNLTRMDRERIVEIGSTLGIDDALLATSLVVSEQFVGTLKSGAVVGQLTAATMLPPPRDRNTNRRHEVGDGNEYMPEIARIERATEIILRIDWSGDVPQALVDAVIECRDAALKEFPLEQVEA